MPRARKKRLRAVDPTNYVQVLGDQIRRHRLALDLAQADVAARAGISLKYLGEVERGDKNPTATTIGRIALAVGWNGFDARTDTVTTAIVSEADHAFRDDLMRCAFPVALAEFYRSGGSGMAWDSYDDLAGSIVNAVDAMLRARKK